MHTLRVGRGLSIEQLDEYLRHHTLIQAVEIEKARHLDSIASLCSNHLSLTFLQAHIHNGDFSKLNSIRSLREVLIRQSNLDDQGAVAVASLPCLTQAVMSSNRVGDEGAAALATTPTLTFLDLS